MTLPRVPQAVVIIAACVFFVLMTFVGFRLLTADAEIPEAATCETRVIEPDELVTANLITVDVLNGSQRAGLANRVSINLQRKGYLPGRVANSDIEVESSGVTIVTSDPEDPRIRLVTRQFGDVDYVEPQGTESGDRVTVVVGDDTDQDLRDEAPLKTRTEEQISICVPLTPEVL